MKSWLVIIVGLIACWNLTDLDSPSGFQNLFCPLMLGVFLIALLVKVVFLIGPGSGRGGHGGDGGGGGDCGGDGGGC